MTAKRPPLPARVIFLDFDGVLMTLRTHYASPWLAMAHDTPDPVLCCLLRRVGDTGVALVVSSTWRDCESTCKAKLHEGDLLDYLHPTDWRTGEQEDEDGQSRPREIADWLRHHPEVTDYLILDDEAWAWTDHQLPRWLPSSPDNGLPANAMKQLADWAGLTHDSKPNEQ